MCHGRALTKKFKINQNFKVPSNCNHCITDNHFKLNFTRSTKIISNLDIWSITKKFGILMSFNYVNALPLNSKKALWNFQQVPNDRYSKLTILKWLYDDISDYVTKNKQDKRESHCNSSEMQADNEIQSNENFSLVARNKIHEVSPKIIDITSSYQLINSIN